MKKLNSIWKRIKERGWYIILLVASTVYVYKTHSEINQLKELNVQNLIFLLWLLLLFWPLFSEMEFLGVKIKKEVEKETADVKNDVQTIKAQIVQLQMSNTVANNISLSSTSLPSEQKIEELLRIVRGMQTAHANESISSPTPIIHDESKNVYLFKVRLAIETTLRELCEKLDLHINSLSVEEMAHALNHVQVINGMTCDLISQVAKIATRGVHGEIVSHEYMTFVQETYPEIVRQLNEVNSALRFIICPKCKYSGYSTNENFCPKCGNEINTI